MTFHEDFMQSFSVNFSKPHMQRALVMSLLSEGETKIVNPSSSTEIEALFAACVQLGLKVICDSRERLVVRGVGSSISSPDEEIYIRGSGALLRILISIVYFTPKLKLTLVGNKSLNGRPLNCFLSELKSHGLHYELKSTDKNFIIYLENRVSEYAPININVRADMTSQFVSALLLAAPISKHATIINVDSPVVVSQTYIDLTVGMMKECGIELDKEDNNYQIKPQAYQVESIEIPSDFTSASYLIGLSLTSQKPIVIENYFPSSFEAERLFYDTAKKMGLDIIYDESNKKLTVIPLVQDVAKDLIVDANKMPTVVPTIIAMAPYFKGNFVLHNASHVENHKTRRLSVITNELKKLGIKYNMLCNSAGEIDGFVTFGRQEIKHKESVDPKGDHRNFMSLFIATINAPFNIDVSGDQLVHASFPDFMSQMKNLKFKEDDVVVN